MRRSTLALCCEEPARGAEARALARRLSLTLGERCVDDVAQGCDHLLVLTAERLELRTLGPKAPGPVYADFIGGKVGYRHRHGGGRGQPIARAVGLKKGANPSVLDATAGLGRDAFVLASLGCEVTLIERSPIVAALLGDALARAELHAESAEVTARMRLIEGDAIKEMAALAGRYDVVHLDPMYPHRD